VGITRADRRRWTEVISRVYWCEGVRRDTVVIHGFGLGFFVGGLPLKDAIENIGATFVPIGTGASDRLVTGQTSALPRPSVTNAPYVSATRARTAGTPPPGPREA
jgi:phenylacetate-CoA ligase